MEIERARALRLAKEQAGEALESAQRSSLLLRKHELHTTVEQSAQLAEASVRQAESKLMETVGLIQEESNKLLEAERVHTLRQNKARMAARQAQVTIESYNVFLKLRPVMSIYICNSLDHFCLFSPPRFFCPSSS